MPPDMRTPPAAEPEALSSAIIGQTVGENIVAEGRNTLPISTEIVVLKAVA